MKIMVVADGSGYWDRFICRWGVSFLIEDDVLFDTFGDPRVFFNNIRKFSIDISKIKHIILSHDDWDHIAGLWYLLDRSNDITVYICPGFKQEIKERIVSFGAKVMELSEPTKIKEGVYSTGQLPQGKDCHRAGEQSLLLKTESGLTIVCGCAHPGVVNIVNYVKDEFRQDAFSLIGGFHLKDSSKTEINHIVSRLKTLNVKKIAPMHCTGKPATELFRKEFEKGFIQVKEGAFIEV